MPSLTSLMGAVRQKTQNISLPADSAIGVQITVPFSLSLAVYDKFEKQVDLDTALQIQALHTLGISGTLQKTLGKAIQLNSRIVLRQDTGMDLQSAICLQASTYLGMTAYLQHLSACWRSPESVGGSWEAADAVETDWASEDEVVEDWTSEEESPNGC